MQNPDSPENMRERLRKLPPVNTLLSAFEGSGGARDQVLQAVRSVLERARQEVYRGGVVPALSDLEAEVRISLETRQLPTIQPAINATGVILHTGLGRAVLSAAAVQNLVAVASGHSTVEVDPESGQRGSRLRGVRELLTELVGCEDALVVNNNAAAVFLALRVLSAGREVVISRGQLVEIGGQFRIPDVVQASGARLVEVGTTNKTHFSDYEQAVGSDTAVLLHVHPSNFRVRGFTAEVPLKEIAELASRRGVVSLADLGSGALLHLEPWGIAGEPTVQAVMRSGVDLCTWSGDKLLGGPQCGIITGRENLLRRMKRDPLMRALRVDKLTLAALEGTLLQYRDPEAAAANIPTLSAMMRPVEQVREAADRLARVICGGESSGCAAVRVVETEARVGGGSLPDEDLPSAAVEIRPCEGKAGELARRLRLGTPAVYARVSRERVLLDMRTVRSNEEACLADAIAAALKSMDEEGGR